MLLLVIFAEISTYIRFNLLLNPPNRQFNNVMKTLFTNIQSLIQVEAEDAPRKLKVLGADMKKLPCIDNAYLLIDHGVIKAFGPMSELNDAMQGAHKYVDATGKLVMPAWCDSHTHLVFAASREQEFVDRINGLTYQEIALRGGGILNSVKKLRDTSEDDLVTLALPRLLEIMHMGTGAVEIKSGYGLSFDDELKMLRVIKRLKEEVPITIKATFLGAHAIPAEFKEFKEIYIRLIIDKMMPAIEKEQLAEYCDVFCEQNYFTAEDTKRILEAGLKYGLKPRVHAEQLSNSGGVLAGVACGAISVDHLEYVGDAEIAALKNSNTMPTLLPGAAMFLGLPNPPARQMIDAGLAVAIASDYNPGSSPCGNMHTMISLACIQYKMTPEEAINAATLNTAYAMDLSETHGSIAIGKKANLIVTKEIPNYSYIPYAFGSNLIDEVYINGDKID